VKVGPPKPRGGGGGGKGRTVKPIGCGTSAAHSPGPDAEEECSAKFLRKTLGVKNQYSENLRS
jgi:hypothetical protein